ncbi:mechanosensitive ion channel [Caminibacter mediatlanticus TB-2]|uniref:Mechanosensitive ion channel n=1 Tax=Caminibacter mediatlanticus TB-2 TaxID=391592 RepID=A0ABX5VAI6_9BACT|nr:mechanosensitive ion channel domain-containing protein [Caminibacter mediatlanticus]QCT95305.1 mechanosensitive ion channel [Caminibacter mediatlanticus TB-2]
MRIVSFIFLFVFLFGSDNNLTKILNKIDKNSPDYSYALILVKKINNLKPNIIKCECDVKNSNDFINNFLKIVNLRDKTFQIDNKLKELNKKIEVLNNTPLSDLEKIYYQKLEDVLKTQKEFINKNLPIWERELFDKLNLVNFNTQKAKTNILKLKNKLDILKREFEKLNIELQKWILLNNTTQINSIQNLIEKNVDKQKQVYMELIKNNLVLFFDGLTKKEKKVFDLDKKIVELAKKLSLDRAIEIEIKNFEKLEFKNKYLLYSSKQEVENVFDKFINMINYPLFKINKKEITPLDLFIFLLILFFGWFVGKYYKKLIYSLRKKYDINYSTATLLANMGYYFILTLAFLIALKSIGLDLSSLAIVAGALSVGIGFGLQNIVSNFVSGIIMMFEKSIKVGDYIQIDQTTRGEVVDISMRSTVIKTNDNINLIIPNQTFIQNQVINWTMNDDIVRFRVPFGVAYGTDIDKMEKILLEELQKSNLPFIRSKNENLIPRIVFIEMGNSSLNFELFVWVNGKFARMPRRTRSKFLKFIYKKLNEYGFEIPFPQNDIHFRNELEVKLKK